MSGDTSRHTSVVWESNWTWLVEVYKPGPVAQEYDCGVGI